MPSFYKKIIRNPHSQLRVTQDLRWNPLVYFEHETIPQNMKDLSPKERGVHTISFAVFNDTLLLKVEEQRTCDLVLKWLNEDKDLPLKVKKQFPRGYEYLTEYVKEQKVELAFIPNKP